MRARGNLLTSSGRYWALGAALLGLAACGSTRAPSSSLPDGGEPGSNEAGSTSSAGTAPGGIAGSSAGSTGNGSAGGGTSAGGDSGAAGGAAGHSAGSGPDGDGDPGFGGKTGVDDYDATDCRLKGGPTLSESEGGLAAPLGACSNWGELACSAAGSVDSLVCDQGVWQVLQHCEENQRCDRRSGVCSDIAAGCEELQPSDTFCDGNAVVRCGLDRVTTVREACCGPCTEGVCQAPACGNGRTEAPEQCDDQNVVPGDGCEPDCQPSVIDKLAAGDAFTCALLRGGFVRCWGDNTEGQLGLADVDAHVERHPHELGPIHLGARAQALALGARHACALLTDGTVQCWGANDHGQLGLGHTRGIGDNEYPSPKASRVQLGEKVQQLAAGGDTTCALLESKSVRCWGDNRYGQLGLGHTYDVGDDELPTAEVATVQIAAKARGISVDGEFACATVGDFQVACWGRNQFGQLGLDLSGDVGDDELPSSVPVFDAWAVKAPISMLESGGGRSCAAGPTEEFNCWGNNEDGGLGTSYVGRKPGDLTLSTLVAWSSAPVQLGVGGGHQCTLVQNKNFFCWGLNAKGQIGKHYTYTAGGAPGAVDGIPVDLGKDAEQRTPAMLDFALGSAHTCVLLEDNQVRCWGWNHAGQLGFGFSSAAPVDYVGGDADHVPLKLPLVKVLTGK